MAVTKKPYNPSDMRFTGVLQQNQPVSDGSGGQTDNWIPLLTTRVALEKRSGKLMDGAGQIQYWKDYKLTCRFQQAISVDADSRWLINGQSYKVQDFDKVDLIPHLYEFIVIKNQ